MYMNKDIEQPIGYWLKHLDRLIENAMARTFAEEGITRRHWQILNILRRSPQDEPALEDALRPFWGEGVIALGEVTKDLATRSWLTKTDGRYTLTQTGETAHATVEKKIQAIRTKSLTDLTNNDYHQTVTTLQQMAKNLEP